MRSVWDTNKFVDIIITFLDAVIASKIFLHPRIWKPHTTPVPIKLLVITMKYEPYRIKGFLSMHGRNLRLR